MSNVLDRFSPATREWFSGAFPEPTTAQSGAWDAISRGSHALVVAPTGSGKTLAAFLWAIDRLAAEDRDHAAPARHPRPLHLSAEGPRRRRRAQPPRAAGRHHPDGETTRSGAAARERRRPLGRHHVVRSSRARDESARHPDHDTRVAVPDAHLGRPRDARIGRDGHRRRSARRRRHQARGAPRALPRTARRHAGEAGAADRPLGDSASRRGGGAVPRWSRARRDRVAAHPESDSTCGSSFPSKT